MRSFWYILKNSNANFRISQKLRKNRISSTFLGGRVVKRFFFLKNVRFVIRKKPIMFINELLVLNFQKNNSFWKNFVNESESMTSINFNFLFRKISLWMSCLKWFFFIETNNLNVFWPRILLSKRSLTTINGGLKTTVSFFVFSSSFLKRNDRFSKCRNDPSLHVGPILGFLQLGF